MLLLSGHPYDALGSADAGAAGATSESAQKLAIRSLPLAGLTVAPGSGMHNPWKLTTFTLVAVLAAVVGNSAVNPASAGVQPHMQSALSSLKSAQQQLEKATADKGGHRVKAMALTRDAILQVEKGIAFDNKH